MICDMQNNQHLNNKEVIRQLIHYISQQNICLLTL